MRFEKSGMRYEEGQMLTTNPASFKKIFLFVIPVSALATTVHSYADVDMRQFCEKIKSCALQQMGTEELPEGMKAIAMNAINTMCEAKVNEFTKSSGSSLLEKKADACLESMSELSCEVLMNDEHTTPACEDFRQSVNAPSQ